MRSESLMKNDKDSESYYTTLPILSHCVVFNQGDGINRTINL